MTSAPTSESVRSLVRRTFEEFSPEVIESPWLSEMLLISEGRFLGRSYRAGELLAIWLAEVGLVQIYGANGQMLRTINLFAESDAKPMAA